MEMMNNVNVVCEFILYVDAKSVYNTVVSAMMKIPGEASLVAHLLWLREMFNLGVISAISWVDTRDMLADALTKGLPDRAPILDAMQGILKMQHIPEISYSPKLNPSQLQGNDTGEQECVVQQ